MKDTVNSGGRGGDLFAARRAWTVDQLNNHILTRRARDAVLQRDASERTLQINRKINRSGAVQLWDCTGADSDSNRSKICSFGKGASNTG
jgi:hypothetical protein